MKVDHEFIAAGSKESIQPDVPHLARTDRLTVVTFGCPLPS